jgi:hypothetical protein
VHQNRQIIDFRGADFKPIQAYDTDPNRSAQKALRRFNFSSGS